MKFNTWVRDARNQLVAHEYEATQVDWLVMDIMDWSRTDYVMHQHDDMTDQVHRILKQGLLRLLKGEPVQYIVEKASFFNRDFKVTQDVLIPRPETEEVVMKLMEMMSSGQVADIGTGSGIIAITLKKEMPQLNVWATDISENALDIAKYNAEKNQADIQFVLGDTLVPLIQKGLLLDGLISNPPYICQSEQDVMSESTLNYEPHIALFAEDNGLGIYRKILKQLPFVMKDDAPIVFEIGYQQGPAIKKLVTSMYPHLKVDVIADINGHDRIISFRWRVSK